MGTIQKIENCVDTHPDGSLSTYVEITVILPREPIHKFMSEEAVKKQFELNKKTLAFHLGKCELIQGELFNHEKTGKKS